MLDLWCRYYEELRIQKTTMAHKLTQRNHVYVHCVCVCVLSLTRV